MKTRHYHDQELSSEEIESKVWWDKMESREQMEFFGFINKKINLDDQKFLKSLLSQWATRDLSPKQCKFLKRWFDLNELDKR